MRRALNVLQVRSVHVDSTRKLLMIFDAKACHAAYEVTDETAVYTCTGNPHPSDIEDIMNSMMNDSFETSYRSQFRLSCSRFSG